jgi:hypothetical protein
MKVAYHRERLRALLEQEGSDPYRQVDYFARESSSTLKRRSDVLFRPLTPIPPEGCNTSPCNFTSSGRQKIGQWLYGGKSQTEETTPAGLLGWDRMIGRWNYI